MKYEWPLFCLNIVVSNRQFQDVPFISTTTLEFIGHHIYIQLSRWLYSRELCQGMGYVICLFDRKCIFERIKTGFIGQISKQFFGKFSDNRKVRDSLSLIAFLHESKSCFTLHCCIELNWLSVLFRLLKV